MKHYQIFTDGSCLKNPGGAGGIGAVIITDGYYEEVSCGFEAPTTNNQMEMYAAIIALESLPERSKVTLISDSQYLINTMSKGWKKKKNLTHWNRLDSVARNHSINWKWVKGHNGNKYNELCDHLAMQAALSAQSPAHAGNLMTLPCLNYLDDQLSLSLAI